MKTLLTLSAAVLAAGLVTASSFEAEAAPRGGFRAGGFGVHGGFAGHGGFRQGGFRHGGFHHGGFRPAFAARPFGVRPAFYGARPGFYGYRTAGFYGARPFGYGVRPGYYRAAGYYPYRYRRASYGYGIGAGILAGTALAAGLTAAAASPYYGYGAVSYAPSCYQTYDWVYTGYGYQQALVTRCE
ncbi:MAG TPA: hypothetical protein VIL65_08375 [Beijerinckiaceae bacterium]|jgi:hypothetical protein